MKRQAFTLVELSIVLVILGLLVGGVLTGQALIRSAELRAIATEKDRYLVALNTFKDKYFALPGDMPNAYQYWGDTCGTNTADYRTGCNGNGNGLVIESGEGTKVWEHLSRAGLIEGAYDGMGGAEPTRNGVPASKFSQGYWNMNTTPVEEPALAVSDRDASNNITTSFRQTLKLAIGSLGDGASDGWVDPLSSLTNAEALNVDTKVDDGRAALGKVRGRNGTCDDNGTSTVAGTDYYRLTATGANATGKCYLVFILQ